LLQSAFSCLHDPFSFWDVALEDQSDLDADQSHRRLGDSSYSLVVIHLPLVDKHAGVLGDVIAIQRRRFCRTERNTGGGEEKLDPQLRSKTRLGES